MLALSEPRLNLQPIEFLPFLVLRLQLLPELLFLPLKPVTDVLKKRREEEGGSKEGQGILERDRGLTGGGVIARKILTFRVIVD